MYNYHECKSCGTRNFNDCHTCHAHLKHMHDCRPDPGTENCAPCHPKKHNKDCEPTCYESEACPPKMHHHCEPHIDELKCAPHCHDDIYGSQREVICKVNEITKRMNVMSDQACGTFARLEKITRQQGAYYGECTINTIEGYSAEDDCPYIITEIKRKDGTCKPVRMQLHLAYNNTSNSKLTEGIFEASEIELADKMVAAIPVSDVGWFGKVRYQGTPIPADPGAGLYTVGFTKKGRMKWYSNSVSDDQIRRDEITDAMGVSGILCIDGQVSSENLRDKIPNANTKAARVCMGQNYETGAIYLLTCGGWETANGMYSKTAGELLAGYGCNVGVELCSGADACATDKGSMMFVPDDGKVPQLYAYWYVSRKCHFTNDFQWEIAKLMQKYGQALYQLKLHEMRLNVIDDRLADHDQRLEVIESELVKIWEEITVLQERVTTLETQMAELTDRVIDLETRMTIIEMRVNELRNDVDELRVDLTAEIDARIAGDALLQVQINQLQTAISNLQDLVMQINETLSSILITIAQIKAQMLIIEVTLADHETRITLLENSGGGIWNEERIVAIENKDIEQDARLDNLEAGSGGGGWEEERVVIIENEIDDLQERVTNLEQGSGGGGWQEERVAGIEEDIADLQECCEEGRGNIANIFNTLEEHDGRITQNTTNITNILNEITGPGGIVSDITDLEARVTANTNKNLAQDGTIANMLTRLDVEEGRSYAMDTRVSDVEYVNLEQNSRLDDLEARKEWDEPRIVAIESKNTTQDTAIAANTAKNSAQDTSITANTTKNNAQDLLLNNIKPNDVTVLKFVNTALLTHNLSGEIQVSLNPTNIGFMCELNKPSSGKRATFNISLQRMGTFISFGLHVNVQDGFDANANASIYLSIANLAENAKKLFQPRFNITGSSTQARNFYIPGYKKFSSAGEISWTTDAAYLVSTTDIVPSSITIAFSGIYCLAAGNLMLPARYGLDGTEINQTLIQL